MLQHVRLNSDVGVTYSLLSGTNESIYYENEMKECMMKECLKVSKVIWGSVNC